jgi:hypothetical protein
MLKNQEGIRKWFSGYDSKSQFSKSLLFKISSKLKYLNFSAVMRKMWDFEQIFIGRDLENRDFEYMEYEDSDFET